MKWICVIAILLCFTSVKTNLSILTDEKNKTLSSVETKNSESYELTLLRLMINQETTLRLNLVKHVHDLISDVSLIKQSLRASETTIEGLKQTIVSLQRENMQLNNSSNARIGELETKLQRVNAVGEQKTSITGLRQTIETFAIQVNSLQEENGEIKNRSINNHARIMEQETKLRTVNEDINIQVNSLQLERSGFRNGIINNHAMIMELKTRLQTVNESVSSLHEHVDVIQRESNRELRDITVEIRNLSRTFSYFRKHREAENELMENLENHFNSSLGNSTYVNSPTSKKFNSLEAHFADNLYRTFAHFETNLKTLKNEQVKLSSAVDSLENAHVNNCDDWTFGLSCDECACVQLHSEFCDKKNGQCHCKQGYTGDACQCEDNGRPCQHHIRLVNADNITSMGRVEVVTNGVWSTVCDTDWDHNDATVACKQLGLGMNGIGVSNATFGKGIGPNFISEVDCKGNETDIFNCSFVKLSCSHANDAGVICVNKSDSIRLVNGSFATNGRLEVRLEGRGPWGTVCDNGFTKNDARVACRELGLPTRHVEVKASAFYGRGSGLILMNHLRCTGNESSLQLCPKQKHPVHCVHSEDVGVSCFNDCPSFTYGVECEKTCICDQNKSLSCDKDTGECLCKDGWAGVRCTCRHKSDCDENSYCDGTSCVCNDGFLTKPSNCSGEDFVLYSCSFETDLKMCSITNYGKMKWKRHSKGTSSDGTGPYSAKEGTFYVYTEASGGSKGDEGVMKISLTNLNLTTYACIQFYYHMRGRGMGELDVIIEDKSGSEVGRWSRSGNINSDWNQGLISLPANAEMVKVTGRRSENYTSDIALDDFKIFYCLNKSDSIRLVNGSFVTNGRLEVRLEGRGPWGTVCDDGFTKNDARVACRELGLPTRNVEVKTSAFYGRGSGLILMNLLSCIGNESSLQLCQKQIHPSNCNHSEDVGVSCSNGCPSFTYGVECEKTCSCDQNKSLSCDKDTGECLCKDGWAGVRCNCRNKSDCDENSYCDGTSCVCNDGFLTKPSNCSGEDFVLYSCSFETDLKTCSITNYGEMKWKRHSRGTPSDDTGPYSAKEGKFYVYTEATCGSKGDERVMKIPLKNLNLTTYACFQFYYHMRGRGMGELDVIIEDKSGSEVGRWSRSGNVNTYWNQGFILLPANAEMVKVTGRRGDDFTSDIALDDLKIFYCLNKSDSIRLVNGSFVTNGRLEVRLEGRGPWGTVCDNGFTKNDARVACRELGLPTRHVEVKASAFYGRGSGLILMNLLRCTGNESTLQLCQKQKYPSSCNHSEDVGVSCSNGCPSFTYGVECEKTCSCDQNKSLSCDKDTGECLCKDGWAGVRCTCRNKSDCDENSYCDGTSCVCNDGFLIKPSNCSGEAFVLYSCSFETDLKTCSITNYGEMKWKRHSRGTPSDDTGPYSAKEGKFYVYTEATGGSKGDEGVMKIPLKNLNLTTYACFQFYYHMRGRGMGELDVIIEDKSGSEVGRWSRSGNVNTYWNQGFILLPANAEMVKVTGRRGDDFTSDIALDDLKIFYCLNKSDSIRLVNGSFVTNGRLEVRLEGRGPWGTVCDNGFTKNDARVTCRELGLPTRHVEVKASAFYGRGSGLILMNLLRCTGNESSLQLCQKQKYPSSCNHSEDVGVSCSNECEKTCICDQNKSLSCDKDTGECLCKDGWAGVRCTCRNKSDCDENSYCDGTSCVCNDGFLTKTSNCSGEVFVLYSCSFETDLKTCSITNYGKMKWKRHSGETPSHGTGPYSAKEGTFYVSTEASGGSKGDEVMKISLTNLNLTTYACFQFYYHMRGNDMGELDVIIEDKSGSEVGRWSMSGNVNSDWNQGFISLPANAEMVKVTGRRGSSLTSDIALDDLKLFHCTMPDHVAFHAVAYSPTNNAVVIFDHVITNVGGGYDNTTGVFTVPTPGLYVFSWTIETYGQRTEAVLLVNGVQQALSRADQASSYYDTTTSFAVLNLTLNDKININVTMGSAQAMHTMFSGWKINKTDDTAFSASLSRKVTGSTIVFNNETLDTDSAYSTSTGRFVAPRSGLYVFMMSATAYGSSNFYTKFVFSNGNSQPKVWVDSESGLYDSSSYMSFGWLNASDYVYVDAERMTTNSMFAGWQLVVNSNAIKSNYPVFLAHLSSRSSKTPVIFDKTHSNYHHGYSVSTGAFTADRDGVYLFLYNIEAQREIVRTTLRVNGEEKFETRSDGRHSNFDDTSAVTVLELSVNDQVSVGVKDGTVDNPESLFFGVLLIET